MNVDFNKMTTETYSPGLHKLVTLEVEQTDKLTDADSFIRCADNLIENYGLEKIGLISHKFDNNSFTIAICLKESHICIHTWPEFNQLTMDVYLCNYLQDNSQKVKDITLAFINYFEATVLKDFELNR